MHSRVLRLLAVFVLAVAIGYLFGRVEMLQPVSVPPVQVAEQVPPETVWTLAEVTGPLPRTVLRAHQVVSEEAVSLPAFELPFAQQLDALVSAAQRGQPQAACRLHLGVHRCHMAVARLWMARDMQKRLEAGNGARFSEDRMLDSIASTYEIELL